MGETLEKTFVIALVTTANKQEAEKIIRRLLNEKLIACANIISPVSSHFHWSGKIEKAEECLILMKSRKDLFEKLAETVKSLALPIINGSKTYLDWLESCLRQDILDDFVSQE